MKGISSIIASILLLIITIGLAGTAYLFISGMLTGIISKTISVLDASCIPFSSTQGNITIILANEGTTNITDSDLVFMVDNQIKNDKFYFSPIPPHSSGVNTSTDGYSLGTYHTLVVASPSNSIRTNVWC